MHLVLFFLWLTIASGGAEPQCGCCDSCPVTHDALCPSPSPKPSPGPPNNCEVTLSSHVSSFHGDGGASPSIAQLKVDQNNFKLMATISVSFTQYYDWFITEASLWAGDDLRLVPETNGTINITQFPHHIGGLHTWIWMFPMVYDIKCPGTANVSVLAFITLQNKNNDTLVMWVGDQALGMLVPVDCNCDCLWTEWSAWSDCSVLCGGGIQTRQQTCVNEEVPEPLQRRSQSRLCNTCECYCESPGPARSPSPFPTPLPQPTPSHSKSMAPPRSPQPSVSPSPSWSPRPSASPLPSWSPRPSISPSSSRSPMPSPSRRPVSPRPSRPNWSIGPPPIPQSPSPSPMCRDNDFYEFFNVSCVPIDNCVGDPTGLCNLCGPKLNGFLLSSCKYSLDYYLALSYAEGNGTITGKACIVLNLVGSIVVLTVPHRLGHNTDCSIYCSKYCASCTHRDLTARGLDGVDGAIANFVIGKAQFIENFTVIYTFDRHCPNTDQYTIHGGRVMNFSLPTFDGDEPCKLGMPPNLEPVCVLEPRVTPYIVARTGNIITQAGLVFFDTDGANLLVRVDVPYVWNITLLRAFASPDLMSLANNVVEAQVNESVCPCNTTTLKIPLESLGVHCTDSSDVFSFYVEVNGSLWHERFQHEDDAWAKGIPLPGSEREAFYVQLSCGVCPPRPVVQQCGKNALIEVASQCNTTGPCGTVASCQPSFHAFQMGQCQAVNDEGYQVAVSVAPPVVGIPTQQICLIVEMDGGTVLVLTLPHRLGTPFVNCSVYCANYCGPICTHQDLSSSLGEGTVSINGTSLTIDHAFDIECSTADIYTIGGGNVRSFSIPSFTNSDTCAPGTNTSYATKRFACSSSAAGLSNAIVNSESLGGRLATQRTPAEAAQTELLQCVVDLQADKLWLGGKMEAGQWVWTADGLALGWDNWAVTKLGAQDLEACLALETDGTAHRWTATSCDGELNYLMELPDGPQWLLKYTGDDYVCLDTNALFSSPGCPWEYFIRDDDPQPHMITVEIPEGSGNDDWGWQTQVTVDDQSPRSQVVCIYPFLQYLRFVPRSSINVTYKVDNVAVHQRTITAVAVPAAAIGTATQVGVYGRCNLYHLRGTPLEIRIDESDPDKLFMYMTLHNTDDPSQLYGTSASPNFVFADFEWQALDVLNVTISITYNKTQGIGCSKVHYCQIHFYSTGESVGPSHVLEDVQEGTALIPGMEYTLIALPPGPLDQRMYYSVWAYCAKDPALIFRLTEDSESTRLQFTAPPYNGDCDLYLFARMTDSSGNMFSGTAVPYVVADSNYGIAIEESLQNMGSVRIVLNLLIQFALLRSDDLLPTFVANVSDFVDQKMEEDASFNPQFLKLTLPSWYAQLMYLPLLAEYCRSLAKFLIDHLQVLMPNDILTLAGENTEKLAYTVGLLMEVFSMLASDPIPGQSQDGDKNVAYSLREILVSVLLPMHMYRAPESDIHCLFSSSDTTGEDQCFSICLYTTTVTTITSKRAFPDPSRYSLQAAKDLITWGKANYPWIATNYKTLQGLSHVSVASLQIYSKCNPDMATMQLMDPAWQVIMMDADTMQDLHDSIGTTLQFKMPIITDGSQVCEFFDTTSQTWTSSSNIGYCTVSGLGWMSATMRNAGSSYKSATDNATISVCKAGTSVPIIAIIPLTILGFLAFSCLCCIGWFLIPPQKRPFGPGPFILHVTSGRSGEGDADRHFDDTDVLPGARHSPDPVTAIHTQSFQYGYDDFVPPEYLLVSPATHHGSLMTVVSPRARHGHLGDLLTPQVTQDMSDGSGNGALDADIASSQSASSPLALHRPHKRGPGKNFPIHLATATSAAPSIPPSHHHGDQV